MLRIFLSFFKHKNIDTLTYTVLKNSLNKKIVGNIKSLFVLIKFKSTYFRYENNKYS